MAQPILLTALLLALLGLTGASAQQPPGPAPSKARVIVLGDSLAEGMAPSLVEALADVPQLEVQKRIRASSGIVREDHYDWRRSAREIVAEGAPRAVVVLMGSNDRQAMQTPAGRFQPLSDAWRAEYVSRVDEILRVFREAGAQVYWVGLPPMPGNRVSADMEALNEITRERAQAAGAEFIDVWDGFASDDGRFTPVGPDLEGVTRRLRASDGIHFTKNGNEKLAHYVEEEIRADLASEAEPAREAPSLAAAVPPGSTDAPPPMPPPGTAVAAPASGPAVAVAARPAGPVRSLTAIAGEAALLDVARKPAPASATAAPPKPGRADDMRWPR